MQYSEQENDPDAVPQVRRKYVAPLFSVEQ
jgi:hypothetical protein